MGPDREQAGTGLVGGSSNFFSETDTPSTDCISDRRSSGLSHIGLDYNSDPEPPTPFASA